MLEDTKSFNFHKHFSIPQQKFNLTRSELLESQTLDKFQSQVLRFSKKRWIFSAFKKAPTDRRAIISKHLLEPSLSSFICVMFSSKPLFFDQTLIIVKFSCSSAARCSISSRPIVVVIQLVLFYCYPYFFMFVTPLHDYIIINDYNN